MDAEYDLTGDKINYKSICCEKIPDLFLDMLVAKNHFSKFGKINRFILRPNRQSCTVEYDTEDQAERALLEAGNYKGHTFKVAYAEREVAHVQNTEKWVDSEVQAELDAMNPGQRLSRPTPVAASSIGQLAAKVLPMRTAVKPAQMLPPKMGKSTPPPEAPKVDAALRQELEAMLRKPAYTDEDRYRVLDARDKLIRLTTVRQTDIKKAVSTKGTCPDMCPEKERWMREYQRQVSSFEMAADNEQQQTAISHRRAIKEYSRSSADQEVPLSHELRPERVLQMTMLYLMHRIMDLCDDPQTGIADWFHFVWDRTRSIRKDITQQELCSVGTVELVEQCARFHIHCAARLVAEDPSVFDKKINAENLTKCLQSLKYMYHDLRIKNVPCPAEAEFRSYIVLLNLGDANFLWELKQLPAHIQNSREIRRAIAFYNALQNNNFVRFFDMIRAPETSYLSACILLGYFNKLRWRAMEAINKSHNWRKNAVFLPLTYLTKVLGFEDEEAAAHYFDYHGLQCDGERVMLDRLKRPDAEYSMERALKLVESKRTVSVGECVCGHNLQSADIFELHIPHSSFDSNGLLKPDAWTAEDQLRGDAAVQKAQERKQQQINQPVQLKPPIGFTTPPSVRTDAGIFKVPQASPPISPKQQQNKLQQQQQQNSTAFMSNQFAPPKSDSGSGSNALGNFKFGAPQNGDISPLPVDSASIFKVPSVKGPTAPTIFGDSIFKPSTAAQSTGSIFGNTGTAGQSIFGNAVKESASLFNDQSTKMPQPIKTEDIFQAPTPELPALKITTSIFGGIEAIKPAAKQAPTPFELPAKQPLSKEPGPFGFPTVVPKPTVVKQTPLIISDTSPKQRVLDVEVERQRAAAEAKLEQERKIAQEREQRIKAASVRQLDQMIDREITHIVRDELAKSHKFERNCAHLVTAVVNDCVLALVEELARDEYAHMCRDQSLLSRYFARWLQHTRKKIQQRALMESTPIWVTTDTRAEQTAKLLHPSEQENLRMIKRYRHGEPCNFKLLLWQEPQPSSKPSVDIFDIVATHLAPKQLLKSGRLQGRKYFKLLLSLPTDSEELPGFESLCNKWLQKHVRQPHRTQDNADKAPFICAAEREVALCVRKLTGVLTLNEHGARLRSEADHADAVVCFMSSVNLQNTRKRLHQLLKLSNNHKRLPVGVVIYNGRHDELELEEVLELDRVGKVSAYKFCGSFVPKSQFSFSHELQRALRFVARECSSCNDEADALEMQTLQNWLELCLGDEMWQRWHESSLQNPAFAKICSTPAHVISIYNDALQRMCEIVSEDFEEAPEFPQELREFVPPKPLDVPLGLEYFPHDWKNTARQQQIVEFLRRLQLPTPTEGNPEELEQLELWLLNYASECMPRSEEAATQASYQAIKVVIEQLNREDLQMLELPHRIRLLNFLHVIKPLAFARINHVLQSYFSRPAKQPLPAELVYKRQALQDYQTVPWWLNCAIVEAVTVDYTHEEQEEPMADADEFNGPNEDESLEAILTKAEAIAAKAEQQLGTLRRQSGNTSGCERSRDLDTSLYQFELLKKVGAYDVSFAEQVTDEIDAELAEAAGEGEEMVERGGGDGDRLLIGSRKRKHAESERNEVDEVLARAFSLIEKVETRRDEHERQRRAAQLELEYF